MTLLAALPTSVKASFPTLSVGKEAFTTFRGAITARNDHGGGTHTTTIPQQPSTPDRHVPNATYETLSVPNEAFGTLTAAAGAVDRATDR